MHNTIQDSIVSGQSYNLGTTVIILLRWVPSSEKNKT